MIKNGYSKKTLSKILNFDKVRKTKPFQRLKH